MPSSSSSRRRKPQEAVSYNLLGHHHHHPRHHLEDNGPDAVRVQGKDHHHWWQNLKRELEGPRRKRPASQSNRDNGAEQKQDQDEDDAPRQRRQKRRNEEGDRDRVDSQDDDTPGRVDRYQSPRPDDTGDDQAQDDGPPSSGDARDSRFDPAPASRKGPSRQDNAPPSSDSDLGQQPSQEGDDTDMTDAASMSDRSPSPPPQRSFDPPPQRSFDSPPQRAQPAPQAFVNNSSLPPYSGDRNSGIPRSSTAPPPSTMPYQSQSSSSGYRRGSPPTEAFQPQPSSYSPPPPPQAFQPRLPSTADQEQANARFIASNQAPTPTVYQQKRHSRRPSPSSTGSWPGNQSSHPFAPPTQYPTPPPSSPPYFRPPPPPVIQQQQQPINRSSTLSPPSPSVQPYTSPSTSTPTAPYARAPGGRFEPRLASGAQADASRYGQMQSQAGNDGSDDGERDGSDSGDGGDAFQPQSENTARGGSASSMRPGSSQSGPPLRSQQQTQGYGDDAFQPQSENYGRGGSMPMSNSAPSPPPSPPQSDRRSYAPYSPSQSSQYQPSSAASIRQPYKAPPSPPPEPYSSPFSPPQTSAGVSSLPGAFIPRPASAAAPPNYSSQNYSSPPVQQPMQPYSSSPPSRGPLPGSFSRPSQQPSYNSTNAMPNAFVPRKDRGGQSTPSPSPPVENYGNYPSATSPPGPPARVQSWNQPASSPSPPPQGYDAYSPPPQQNYPFSPTSQQQQPQPYSPYNGGPTSPSSASGPSYNSFSALGAAPYSSAPPSSSNASAVSPYQSPPGPAFQPRLQSQSRSDSPPAQAPPFASSDSDSGDDAFTPQPLSSLAPPPAQSRNYSSPPPSSSFAAPNRSPDYSSPPPPPFPAQGPDYPPPSSSYAPAQSADYSSPPTSFAPPDDPPSRPSRSARRPRSYAPAAAAGGVAGGYAASSYGGADDSTPSNSNYNADDGGYGGDGSFGRDQRDGYSESGAPAFASAPPPPPPQQSQSQSANLSDEEVGGPQDSDRDQVFAGGRGVGGSRNPSQDYQDVSYASPEQQGQDGGRNYGGGGGRSSRNAPDQPSYLSDDGQAPPSPVHSDSDDDYSAAAPTMSSRGMGRGGDYQERPPQVSSASRRNSGYDGDADADPNRGFDSDADTNPDMGGDGGGGDGSNAGYARSRGQGNVPRPQAPPSDGGSDTGGYGLYQDPKSWDGDQDTGSSRQPPSAPASFDRRSPPDQGTDPLQGSYRSAPAGDYGPPSSDEDFAQPPPRRQPSSRYGGNAQSYDGGRGMDDNGYDQGNGDQGPQDSTADYNLAPLPRSSRRDLSTAAQNNSYNDLARHSSDEEYNAPPPSQSPGRRGMDDERSYGAGGGDMGDPMGDQGGYAQPGPDFGRISSRRAASQSADGYKQDDYAPQDTMSPGGQGQDIGRSRQSSSFDPSYDDTVPSSSDDDYQPAPPPLRSAPDGPSRSSRRPRNDASAASLDDPDYGAGGNDSFSPSNDQSLNRPVDSYQPSYASGQQSNYDQPSYSDARFDPQRDADDGAPFSFGGGDRSMPRGSERGDTSMRGEQDYGDGFQQPAGQDDGGAFSPQIRPPRRNDFRRQQDPGADDFDGANGAQRSYPNQDYDDPSVPQGQAYSNTPMRRGSAGPGTNLSDDEDDQKGGGFDDASARGPATADGADQGPTPSDDGMDAQQQPNSRNRSFSSPRDDTQDPYGNDSYSDLPPSQSGRKAQPGYGPNLPDDEMDGQGPDSAGLPSEKGGMSGTTDDRDFRDVSSQDHGAGGQVDPYTSSSKNRGQVGGDDSDLDDGTANAKGQPSSLSDDDMDGVDQQRASGPPQNRRNGPGDDRYDPDGPDQSNLSGNKGALAAGALGGAALGVGGAAAYGAAQGDDSDPDDQQQREPSNVDEDRDDPDQRNPRYQDDNQGDVEPYRSKEEAQNGMNASAGSGQDDKMDDPDDKMDDRDRFEPDGEGKYTDDQAGQGNDPNSYQPQSRRDDDHYGGDGGGGGTGGPQDDNFQQQKQPDTFGQGDAADQYAGNQDGDVGNQNSFGGPQQGDNGYDSSQEQQDYNSPNGQQDFRDQPPEDLNPNGNDFGDQNANQNFGDPNDFGTQNPSGRGNQDDFGNNDYDNQNNFGNPNASGFPQDGAYGGPSNYDDQQQQQPNGFGGDFGGRQDNDPYDDQNGFGGGGVYGQGDQGYGGDRYGQDVGDFGNQYDDNNGYNDDDQGGRYDRQQPDFNNRYDEPRMGNYRDFDDDPRDMDEDDDRRDYDDYSREQPWPEEDDSNIYAGGIYDKDRNREEWEERHRQRNMRHEEKLGMEDVKRHPLDIAEEEYEEALEHAKELAEKRPPAAAPQVERALHSAFARCYDLRALQERYHAALTPLPTAEDLGISPAEYHVLLTKLENHRRRELVQARESGDPDRIRKAEAEHAQVTKHIKDHGDELREHYHQSFGDERTKAAADRHLAAVHGVHAARIELAEARRNLRECQEERPPDRNKVFLAEERQRKAQEALWEAEEERDAAAEAAHAAGHSHEHHIEMAQADHVHAQNELEHLKQTGAPRHEVEEAQQRVDETKARLREAHARAAEHAAPPSSETEHILAAHQADRSKAVDNLRSAQYSLAQNPHSPEAQRAVNTAKRHLAAIEEQRDGHHAELLQRHENASPDDAPQAHREAHLSSVHQVHAARDTLGRAEEELRAVTSQRPPVTRRVEAATRERDEAKKRLEHAEAEEAHLRRGTDSAHRTRTADLAVEHARNTVDSRKRELDQLEQDRCSPEEIRHAETQLYAAQAHLDRMERHAERERGTHERNSAHAASVQQVHAARDRVAQAEDHLHALRSARPPHPEQIAEAERHLREAKMHLGRTEGHAAEARRGTDSAHRLAMSHQDLQHASAAVQERRRELNRLKDDPSSSFEHIADAERSLTAAEHMKDDARRKHEHEQRKHAFEQLHGKPVDQSLPPEEQAKAHLHRYAAAVRLRDSHHQRMLEAETYAQQHPDDTHAQERARRRRAKYLDLSGRAQVAKASVLPTHRLEVAGQSASDAQHNLDEAEKQHHEALRRGDPGEIKLASARVDAARIRRDDAVAHHRHQRHKIKVAETGQAWERAHNLHPGTPEEAAAWQAHEEALKDHHQFRGEHVARRKQRLLRLVQAAEADPTNDRLQARVFKEYGDVKRLEHRHAEHALQFPHHERPPADGEDGRAGRNPHEPVSRHDQDQDAGRNPDLHRQHEAAFALHEKGQFDPNLTEEGRHNARFASAVHLRNSRDRKRLAARAELQRAEEHAQAHPNDPGAQADLGAARAGLAEAERKHSEMQGHVKRLSKHA
ncbi:hypothetical protein JCM11641_005192, partial [Rhodosporidiobolus odoratus]